MKVFFNAVRVCAIGLLFFLFSSNVGALPIIQLEAVDPVAQVGKSFEINVIASVNDVDPLFGADELIAFGFDVTVPVDLVYEGARVASPFNDDSTFFPNTAVAGSVFPGIAGDDILLATLTFTPSLSGIFSVGIASDLTDLNEGLITFLTTVDMTRNLDVTVVPIGKPPVWLLIALAFLAMVRAANRTNETVEATSLDCKSARTST